MEEKSFHCENFPSIKVVVIKGEGIRRDKVNKFDEISAASGGLNRIRGLDLMLTIADFMGYYKMYGT